MHLSTGKQFSPLVNSMNTEVEGHKPSRGLVWDTERKVLRQIQKPRVSSRGLNYVVIRRMGSILYTS